MNKWLRRTAIFLGVMIPLSGLIAYLVVDNALARMYGETTPLAKPQLGAESPDKYLLTNVQVLSADGRGFESDLSVLIADGTIESIGHAQTFGNSIPRVDGGGQYLVPGLTDSHVHLWRSRNDLLLYLANGVTQVREMHAQPHHLNWRETLSAGALGPDLYLVAAQLATYPFWEGLWRTFTTERQVVGSRSATRARIPALIAQGYDAIKASSFLSREHYLTASDAISDSQIPLVGHLPLEANLADLWSSNQRELAHVEELVKALAREIGGYTGAKQNEFLAHVRARRQAVAKQLRARDIAVTTTIALVHSFAGQKLDLQSALAQVEFNYVNPGVARGQAMGWLPGVNPYQVPASRKVGDWQRRYADYWDTYAKAHVLMLEALYAEGVMLLAGTDASVPVMVPGFSMHSELLALQAAGLSPTDVLAAATRSPGHWMNWNTGKIAVGYRANLILLRDNPLEDIAATASLESVIIRGRFLTRQDLDALLLAVEHANRAAD
ncbi:amidohydrolase family protein [Simiduia agarivorans]|uniref:Amidohydrolase n=1 Tax=Simiduia agarivorans (strain DSM 21679 / JCM 13881 / BCRC 17597 / SA1) TaxID=1117647 RepID=K4L439_SIMAS|nr:amidohydrolase family protein [Simiduia agarivorans]AFV00983.1 amidohydrolase [Simiduia agarivorans SA1 = DSM 21679]